MSNPTIFIEIKDIGLERVRENIRSLAAEQARLGDIAAENGGQTRVSAERAARAYKQQEMALHGNAKALLNATVQAQGLFREMQKAGMPAAQIHEVGLAFTQLQKTLTTIATNSSHVREAQLAFADAMANARMAVADYNMEQAESAKLAKLEADAKKQMLSSAVEGVNWLKAQEKAAEAARKKALSEEVRQRREIERESKKQETQAQRAIRAEEQLRKRAMSAEMQQIRTLAQARRQLDALNARAGTTILGRDPGFNAANNAAFASLSSVMNRADATPVDKLRAQETFKTRMAAAAAEVNNLKRSMTDSLEAGSTFSNMMNNIGSSAVLTFGPLSGVGSRIIALAAIAKRSSTLITATFIGVLIALVHAFGHAVRSAKTAQDQMLLLQGTIRATGRESQITAGEILRVARALDLQTLGTTELFTQAAAKLLVYKDIDPSQLSRLLSLAQDIATVDLGSVAESAKKLGEMIDRPSENLDSMKEIGIQFNEEQKRMIKLMEDMGGKTQVVEYILSQIEGRVKGISKVVASELTGAIDSLKMQWDSLFRDLGEGSLIDLSTWAVKGMTEIVKFLRFTLFVIQETFRLLVRLAEAAYTNIEDKIEQMFNYSFKNADQLIDKLNSIQPGKASKALGDTARSELARLSSQIEEAKQVYDTLARNPNLFAGDTNANAPDPLTERFLRAREVLQKLQKDYTKLVDLMEEKNIPLTDTGPDFVSMLKDWDDKILNFTRNLNTENITPNVGKSGSIASTADEDWDRLVKGMEKLTDEFGVVKKLGPDAMKAINDAMRSTRGRMMENIAAGQELRTGIRGIEAETIQLADSMGMLDTAFKLMEDGTWRMNESFAAANEQFRRLRLEVEGNNVFERTRTPLERYNIELAKLNELLKAGAIDQDTFNRASMQAKEELVSQTPILNKLQQEFETLGSSIADAMTEAERPIDALKSALKRLVDALLEAIIQMTIVEKLKSAIFGSGPATAPTAPGGIFGAIGALFGGGSGGVATGAPSTLLGGGGGFDFVFGGGVSPTPGFGFASGGAFRVGGTGGTDSQHVAFKASPNETVTIETPEQMRKRSNGKGDTYYIDARGADASRLMHLERMIIQIGGSVEKRSQAAVSDARRRDPRFFGGNG